MFFAFSPLCWPITVGPKFILDCSATSVDVEEHLYRLSTSMGINCDHFLANKHLDNPCDTMILMVVNRQLAFQNGSVVLLKLFRFSPVITETCLDALPTSMPWSLSSLTAKRNGSYVRSSSESWYQLGVDAIKCTVSCIAIVYRKCWNKYPCQNLPHVEQQSIVSEVRGHVVVSHGMCLCGRGSLWGVLDLSFYSSWIELEAVPIDSLHYIDPV